MRYSKYLMEERIINVDSMTPVLGIVVAVVGLGMLAGMYPLAYAIDKTNDVWQRRKKL